MSLSPRRFDHAHPLRMDSIRHIYTAIHASLLTALGMKRLRFQGAVHHGPAAPGESHQLPVGIEIVVGHAAGGEALLETPADGSARQARELRADDLGGGGLAVDDEAGGSVLDDFGHRA